MAGCRVSFGRGLESDELRLGQGRVRAGCRRVEEPPLQLASELMGRAKPRGALPCSQSSTAHGCLSTNSIEHCMIHHI